MLTVEDPSPATGGRAAREAARHWGPAPELFARAGWAQSGGEELDLFVVRTSRTLSRLSHGLKLYKFAW